VHAVNHVTCRDHGLADFNSVRVAYGLEPKSFNEIAGATVGAELRAAYGDINKIDLW